MGFSKVRYLLILFFSATLLLNLDSASARIQKVMALDDRAVVLSLPTHQKFQALTLPISTPVSFSFHWGAPVFPQPLAADAPGTAPNVTMHEFRDLITLGPDSYILAGSTKLETNCVWALGRDVENGSIVNNRILFLYVAVLAASGGKCVGPLHPDPSYDNDAWSSYVKLIITDFKTYTPAKATFKYGGVEYDLAPATTASSFIFSLSEGI